MTFRIPAALQPYTAQPRWVVWRLEMDGDRPTKRPYQAKAPTVKAMVNRPSTWSDAQTAIDAVAKHGFDGIGICLQGYEQIAFDIDHCRDPTTGEIDPWALALVKRADSYCEITPSKTGLRIIGHGTGERILKKQPVPQANGVTLESYRACAKYITVTGDHLEGTPETLNDISELMDSVVAELDAAKGKKAKDDTDDTDNADDGEQQSTSLPHALRTRLHIRNEGAGKRHADYASRSELTFAFIIDALRSRVSAKTIIAACLDNKFVGCAIFEHCKENDGRVYVVRQIKKARAKIQDELDTAVGEINRTYAMVLAGDKAAIMKFEGDSFRLVQIGGFKQWFANQQVLAGKRVMSKGQYWLNHPQRRQYEGIEFDPSGNGRAGYYNLWRGYNVQPKAGDCSLFLAHLKDNVAQGNKYLFIWVVAWFAQIFQQPNVKLGNSLALRGKTGVGKTKVGQIFGSLIKDHYRLVADPRYVTGQFNAHMASLLLLQADEAFWAGDKRAQGKLKDLITGNEHPIEHKHVDPIWIKNYVRLLATSNEDWTVPAGFDERRFAVLDVGNIHAKDLAYFAAIDEQINSGGREALLQYLLDFDISIVNLREIPKTAALVEQIIEGMSSEQAWWLDTLKNGKLPWGMTEANTCPRGKLFVRYIQHAPQQGTRRRAIETKIGMFLAKHVGSELKKYHASYNVRDKRGDVSREHGRVYEFPSLKACREKFAQEIGHNIAWDSPDEEWEHEFSDDDEIM